MWTRVMQLCLKSMPVVTPKLERHHRPEWLDMQGYCLRWCTPRPLFLVGMQMVITGASKLGFAITLRISVFFAVLTFVLMSVLLLRTN